jgi:hypothetical protein
MFIHLGGNRQISDRNTIGIFNIETLRMSPENDWLMQKTAPGEKTLALIENNTVICSKVSPFTVIKRTSLDSDIVWRREND